MSMDRCKFFAVGSNLLRAMLLLLMLALVNPATALYAAPQMQIPPTINYQGTLRDAQGKLVTGPRDLTFVIYDTGVGGTEQNKLYTESFAAVPVRDGLFNVVLGDKTAIPAGVFANGPRYIGITVAPETEELVPRQRLHPVPWAQLATNAMNATSAATATTLVANATIDGGMTIKDSTFTLNRSNSYWDIQIDANGVLRFVSRNIGFLRLGINPNGTVQIPGDVNTRGVLLDSGTVLDGNGLNLKGPISTNSSIRATEQIISDRGFRGRCAADPGNGQVIVCDQDIAETFATDTRIEPGNLVVFIPEDRTFPAVQRSTQPYEGAIVGVVSTDPGLVFDQGETTLAGDMDDLITDEKTVVAMVGRVPTNFSLENGPIAVGDPLTSSSTPGAAMKATQAGRIIGYAMQSSAAAAEGKLLVWLQPSTHIPAAQLAALNSSTAAVTELSSLSAWPLFLSDNLMLAGLLIGGLVVGGRVLRRETWGKK